MNRKYFLPVIVLCVASLCTTLGALDVSSGNVKLVLHEGIGRFSLYYLVSPETKKYVSLLVDQDTRTSFLSLLVDNKVQRMGESSQFKEKLEKKDYGATRIWTSDWLDATEDFRFTTSGNKGADGVTVSLTITNKSDTKTPVGVRYLFDTYLGERNGAHFATDTSPKMENETSFDKENMIQYWISPQEPPNEPVKVGLKMVTKGGDITTPDRIVFANWKRLSDSLWSYWPPQGRNFSVRPYSINDSAVSVYYNAESLPKGSSRNLRVSLSFYGTNEKEVVKEDASAKTPDEIKKDTEQEMLDILSKAKKTTAKTANITSEEGLKMISDLTTIENLINEINRILYGGGDISDKDLKLMEQMIAELNDRINKY